MDFFSFFAGGATVLVSFLVGWGLGTWGASLGAEVKQIISGIKPDSNGK